MRYNRLKHSDKHQHWHKLDLSVKSAVDSYNTIVNTQNFTKLVGRGYETHA